MTHLSDDDLVLRYYGEDAAEPERARHVDRCPACRDRYLLLTTTLALVSDDEMPERGEAYGRQVWAAIRSEVERPGTTRMPRRWLPWSWNLVAGPRLALVGSVAVLVVAAFLAGRFFATPPRVPPAGSVAELALQGQERILMVAVGQHLERSARLLVEMTNQDGGTLVNISTEQTQASDLTAASRLYRQAALRAGEAGLASILEDLERVFAEITNRSSDVPASELRALRHRLDDTGLLFKVRVAEVQVRQRQPDMVPTRPFNSPS